MEIKIALIIDGRDYGWHTFNNPAVASSWVEDKVYDAFERLADINELDEIIGDIKAGEPATQTAGKRRAG